MIRVFSVTSTRLARHASVDYARGMDERNLVVKEPLRDDPP